MPEPSDTPLPPQLDGEPDLAAEMARLREELADIRERSKQLADETDYDALTTNLESLLTDEQRAALPQGGTRVDQVFSRVTAALTALKRNPVVPATDDKRPGLTPPQVDYEALPTHARIAAGYANA